MDKKCYKIYNANREMDKKDKTDKKGQKPNKRFQTKSKSLGGCRSARLGLSRLNTNYPNFL